MKFGEPFYVVTLSFLALAAFVLILRFWPGNPLSTDVMRYICDVSRCTVQDWLSSTAGWAGFIAAGAGAWLVFGQLAEQRRQTAFLLGDGIPSIDTVRPATSNESARFRLTNWNRRTIVIYSFQIVGDPKLPAPVKVKFYTSESDAGLEEEEINNDGVIDFSPALYGWINRGEAPPHLDFELLFGEKTDALVKANKGRHLNFTITVRHPSEAKMLPILICPRYSECFPNNRAAELALLKAKK